MVVKVYTILVLLQFWNQPCLYNHHVQVAKTLDLEQQAFAFMHQMYLLEPFLHKRCQEILHYLCDVYTFIVRSTKEFPFQEVAEPFVKDLKMSVKACMELGIEKTQATKGVFDNTNKLLKEMGSKPIWLKAFVNDEVDDKYESYSYDDDTEEEEDDEEEEELEGGNESDDEPYVPKRKM